MADQVEPRAGQGANLRRLALELLHVVFAELAQPEVIGLLDRGRGEDLGYRQQQDIRRVAARPVRRSRHPLAHHLQPLGQFCHEDVRTVWHAGKADFRPWPPNFRTG